MKESRRDGAHLWVRNNILGLVAIFIALSGTAVATNVASNPSADKPHAGAAQNQAQAAKKKKRGPAGPQGPQGAQGPVGPSTGAAGGDLIGNYPSPSLRPPEAPRQVQSPGNPAFANCVGGNSWGAVTPTSFSRDPLGYVHLAGSISCPVPVTPAGQIIFILPAGYRPTASIAYFATPEPAVSGFAQIGVDNNGNVIYGGGSAPNTTNSIFLDGIIFRCGPSGSSGCP